MSTLIGIISDVHATPQPVKEALELFKHHGVDHILCAGDIAGYGVELDETIELLIEHQCISILGNHDEWLLEKNQDKQFNSSLDYLSQLPAAIELEYEGKKLYLVHSSPSGSQLQGIRLLDENGDRIENEFDYWQQYLKEFDFDVLVIGHTHQTYAEQIGNALVINPGSTKFNHSCVILSLPEMKVEFFALSGKNIQPVWNWRDFIIKQDNNDM